MQQTDKILNVGDVVYYNSRWHGLEKYPIDRVTAKRAFSSYNQFERAIQLEESPYDKSNKLVVKWVGQYGYANLETPELIAEYLKQRTISKAHDMFSKFKIYTHVTDLESANKMIEFLSSFKNNQQ